MSLKKERRRRRRRRLYFLPNSFSPPLLFCIQCTLRNERREVVFLYGTEASEKDGGGIITQLAVACSEILTRGYCWATDGRKNGLSRVDTHRVSLSYKQLHRQGVQSLVLLTPCRPRQLLFAPRLQPGSSSNFLLAKKSPSFNLPFPPFSLTDYFP